MKKIFILIYLLICTDVYSQNTQSIYEKAPDEVKLRNSFQREKWFYEQRMYPLGYIPTGAYEKAFRDKINLGNNYGFYNKINNWFSIGPTPGINTYYSYVSSRVATVKFHPTNPNIIYLGAACGGVWKTTNGGQNWIPKTDFEISLSSGALAIDNVNPEIIYYGTGEATYFTYSYYGMGILKSTNGGDNWVNYINGLPSMTYFSRLVIKPGNSNILFAALGTSGLYKSIDAGQNWNQIISGRCDDVVFSPDGNRAYCIGQGSGYRISTDGGNTFTIYNPFTLGTRNHIAVCKSASNVLYASVYSGSTVSVYKSTDSGNNFTLLQNNFTGTTQGWYDFYIYVNPFDANYAYVGLVDLWRTTDGNTFSKITNTSAGPVHVDHHNMDFHPTDPDKLICANDGGVWYSSNGGTNWTNLNYTLNLSQFYRVTSDPTNASHILGGTQDNGVQRTTGSLNWNVLIFGGDGGDVCFDSKNSNYIITENQFNRLKRSVDGGINWNTDTLGLSGNAAWIAPIISHPDSTGIFYSARQQVFKSTNYGASWYPYSSGTAGVIREMAISKSHPAILFASSNNYIYWSSNGGLIFTDKTNGLPSRIITSINIHPDSSDVVLITYSGFGGGHIYKTRDGGNTWNDVSGNLPDIPINDGLFYYPGSSTGILLAATDVGVFITNNYGYVWSELANGLPNTVAMHLDFNSVQSKLRVATHGRGVWEYNGNITGISNLNTPVPENYCLYQNYPNPFNPITKIKFDIPETVKHKTLDIKLIVYDIIGREIQTLVNEKLNPGSYEVTFDGSNLPNGVYFYKLRAGEYTETKKMLMIK
ncbi:MAG TPA: T9SS type A sorting domain-containing protein [Ignavibacteria bacterium]